MKDILFLFSSVCCLVSINTHPLIRNVQPYPITDYQQNVYRPYGEVFLVQPSNIDQYSQQVTVQTPLPTYQIVHLPSIIEQNSQMYFDNLRTKKQIACDHIGKEIQSKLHPCNIGGVRNSYVIMPPDYSNTNETSIKKIKTNKVRKVKKKKNKSKSPIKESISSKKKGKNNLNSTRKTQDVELSNKKTTRKVEPNVEQSWNFNTDNIKCFTPADVLQSEKYHPEKKNKKHIDRKKQHNKENKNKISNTSINCKPKSGSQKCKNIKRNKVKKKSKENKNNACKEKREDILPLTEEKKTEQCKKALPVCETNIVEDIPPVSDQDINDLLLNLLQQSCTSLDNRCTRNSKADTVVKDFRNMYPDLSNDISKTMNQYMADFFSPTHNGNKYPFDLTQLYQIPQYSSGNTEVNNNLRRQKKKKKKIRTKLRKDNVTDNNNGPQSEKNITILQNNNTLPEENTETSDKVLFNKTNVQNLEIDDEVPKRSAECLEENSPPDLTPRDPNKITNASDENTYSKPESAIKFTSSELTDVTSVFTKESTTGTECTKPINNCVDKSSDYVQKPNQHLEETYGEKQFEPNDENGKSEEEKSDEIYETQIPNLLVIPKHYEIMETQDEEDEVDEMLPILPEWVPDDEIFKMFMKDYYPDFRADNHAYLMIDDEIDSRSTNDRYFYSTDKTIDSKEVYSREKEHQIYDNRGVFNEDEFEINKVFKNGNKYKGNENDKSQEIVFRTPPRLEVPDFVTRKIYRNVPDSEEIYYQHNNVEDDFDRFNLDCFADTSDEFFRPAKRSNEGNSGHKVETVYANSKVVKYGPSQEVHKSSKAEDNIYLNFKDVNIQNDGDKIVVIAKSLGSDDYW